METREYIDYLKASLEDISDLQNTLFERKIPADIANVYIKSVEVEVAIRRELYQVSQTI